ncbi:MAG: hypothetical protein HY537_04495, partial [Deltaproteobacteria bacterium]|nr:hypothetical protein [Deltaproteobacteria bacterium]
MNGKMILFVLSLCALLAAATTFGEYPGYYGGAQGGGSMPTTATNPMFPSSMTKGPGSGSTPGGVVKQENKGKPVNIKNNICDDDLGTYTCPSDPAGRKWESFKNPEATYTALMTRPGILTCRWANYCAN